MKSKEEIKTKLKELAKQYNKHLSNIPDEWALFTLQMQVNLLRWVLNEE